MTKEEIDQKYLDQANGVEAEFFDNIDEGLPNQHRQLKIGKSIDDFNLTHGQTWQKHEAELIAGGFMAEPQPPEPVRGLLAEIDELKARLDKITKVNGYNVIRIRTNRV